VVLIVLSLLLLTAYFGEAPGGRLHGVQRAFLTVVSPIQNAANKALKPVRDTIGWFGDTINAKSQRDSLRRQNAALRSQLVADQAEKRSLREFESLYHVDQLGVGNYHPVTATVVGKSPSVWYVTVTIDAGSGAGIHVNDPVVNAEGLVGRVAQVASDGAQVDLITDSSMGVSARLARNGSTGIVQPKVGDPGDLLLQYLPSTAQPNPGEYVVTSGTVSSRDDSLYPPGLLIGQVTSVNEETGFKSVNVRPVANLQNLDVVQVLTSGAGSRPSTLASLTSQLPAGQNQQGGEIGAEQYASSGSGG
jgi:rod shape-determining protein MreC